MRNVVYSNSRLFFGNRPYSQVTLLGVSGNPDVKFEALADTGADYLQLPSSAANTAGIDLNSGVSRNVHGATGTSAMIFIRNIYIEVEGKKIRVNALFDQSNSSSALLGRQALLAALDAGFNASEWMWKLERIRPFFSSRLE